MLRNFVLPLYSPEGSGGGTGDGDKGGDTPPDGFVPKAEFDKTKGDLDKVQQEMEDIRLEIFTPDYLEYLENKKKAAPAKKEESTPDDKVDFSKMTPDQLYKKAKDDAKAEMKSELDTVKKEFNSTAEQNVQKEVAAFARSHSDFDKYRPLMHGLSTDPKNVQLTLQELYDLAKQHAKGFGPTEDDKDKSRRSSSEKPGGSSGAYSKDKKYTPDSAAEEAWEETVGKDGLPAV
jgi:hypothetical protein